MRNLIAILVMVLLAIPSMATALTVTLGWTVSTDPTVTGQKVYYSTVNTQPFTGTGATQGISGYSIANTSTTTLSGLDSTKTYYFAITNYNAVGDESAYSNIVSLAAAAKPAAPKNLKIGAYSY